MVTSTLMPSRMGLPPARVLCLCAALALCTAAASPLNAASQWPRASQHRQPGRKIMPVAAARRVSHNPQWPALRRLLQDQSLVPAGGTVQTSDVQANAGASQTSAGESRIPPPTSPPAAPLAATATASLPASASQTSAGEQSAADQSRIPPPTSPPAAPLAAIATASLPADGHHEPAATTTSATSSVPMGQLTPNPGEPIKAPTTVVLLDVAVATSLFVVPCMALQEPHSLSTWTLRRHELH